MPYGDRTGPLGQGPMTGRGFGFCSGNKAPGSNTPGFGRLYRGGFGRGLGRRYCRIGQGFGWRGYSPKLTSEFYKQNISSKLSGEEEKIYLEDMMKDLEEQIKTIKERLQQLSKGKKKASQ
jgi:hypothetical protein